MAERFFVRNNGGTKVTLPLETAGRVIVAPGDQIEYATKAAAEAAAHDYNSTLYAGTPVEVVVEQGVAVDELPEIEEEPGVTEPIIDGPSANTPDAPNPNVKDEKKDTVTFTGDPNAALKGI